MFHSVYFMKQVGNICQRRTEDEKEKQNSKIGKARYNLVFFNILYRKLIGDIIHCTFPPLIFNHIRCTRIFVSILSDIVSCCNLLPQKALQNIFTKTLYIVIEKNILLSGKAGARNKLLTKEKEPPQRGGSFIVLLNDYRPMVAM